MTSPPEQGDSALHRLIQTRTSLVASIRLLALDSMGVSRARWLLRNAEPEKVVECLLRGRLPSGLPDPRVPVTEAHLDRWQAGLVDQDVDHLSSRNLNGSHRIIDAGCEEWPFSDDPDPPILLFVVGRSEVLHLTRRVAVVGTRRCSAVGRSVAAEMGWTLAEQGVSVVSGLALGIDAAAHRGAGSSPSDPGRISVVAGGLDIVYPKANDELWKSVRHNGVLISETPVGERPVRWRFPARNRLIAALSELVVVVESHVAGGALHTVDEALKRNREVVAVPGSVLSRSCGGTNQLLMDGVPPVRGGQDLVDLLGLVPSDSASDQSLPLPATRKSSEPARHSQPLMGREEMVLQALEGGPAHTDALAAATGIDIPTLLSVIQRMRRGGRVEIDGSTIVKALPSGE